MDSPTLDALDAAVSAVRLIAFHPLASTRKADRAMMVDRSICALIDAEAEELLPVPKQDIVPAPRMWILLSGRKRRPGVYDRTQH